MATRAQRRAQRQARAIEKRSKDAVGKAAMRLIKRALAETARYSVLHRLHSRNQISYPQWQAGLRLQQDELGSRDTRTGDLDPDRIRGHAAASGLPTERLAAQVERLTAYRDALGALTRVGGLPLNVTCGVCIGDAGLSQIARVIAVEESTLLLELRQGLEILCAHYDGRRNQRQQRGSQES